MNLLDLTVRQLKRAAAIKEQIEDLNRELGTILGAPARSGGSSTSKRTMSAAAKKRIAAAQRARWAKLQGNKAAGRSVKRTGTAKKKTMSPAARAKLSAKLKAYWDAKKAGRK